MLTLGELQNQFASRIPFIGRPNDTDTATCRGAARYGLARSPLVSTVVAPKSYMIRVRAVAQPIDDSSRPAYIERNGAGAMVCKNRLQYLVTKGAILRKGQRICTRFCKFSQTPLGKLPYALLLFYVDLYAVKIALLLPGCFALKLSNDDDTPTKRMFLRYVAGLLTSGAFLASSSTLLILREKGFIQVRTASLFLSVGTLRIGNISYSFATYRVRNILPMNFTYVPSTCNASSATQLHVCSA